jgi:hypothetical protein
VSAGVRAFRRNLTAALPPGDYALSTTGVTWNVDRATPTGSVMRLVAGMENKRDALARMIELAAADRAQAWEPFGAGCYRLIE